MKKDSLKNFKSLLSVPSKTYEESEMVGYICSVLDNIKNVSYYLDDMNNIYVTKGILLNEEYYPLFIAHTDTVHEIVDEIVVKEESLSKPPTFGRTFSEEHHISLKGYLPNGMPTGIGGDDKCGIFIALELLKILPKVKVALFVSEETGCHGSRNCDLNFLNDVGYAIQFDAPGNHLITEVCSGVRLFEKNGEFIKKVLPVFENTMGVTPELQSHPYTDVSQIKQKGDFSCINFSCGYYNMHSNKEFIVIDDVKNSIDMSVNIVNELSYNKYEFKLNTSSDDNIYTSFFQNDDKFYGEEEEMVDWFDGDNHYFHIDTDTIEVESKSTGDLISLNIRDMGFLYSLIRERLLENDDY